MKSSVRWYIPRSSYFDSHPYNVSKISNAVREAGGTNIRTSNYNGWSNQPKVVTFSLGTATTEKILHSVRKAVGSDWIIIQKKNW